jgi:hypothetical protein
VLSSGDHFGVDQDEMATERWLNPIGVWGRDESRLHLRRLEQVGMAQKLRWPGTPSPITSRNDAIPVRNTAAIDRSAGLSLVSLMTA